MTKQTLFGKRAGSSGTGSAPSLPDRNIVSGEEVYTTLSEYINPDIASALKPLEAAMLNAVSHHGLCDAQGSLLRDHAVTTEYFRRLMYRYARYDDSGRAESQQCLEKDFLRYDQQIDSFDSVVDEDERFLLDREFASIGTLSGQRDALRSKSSNIVSGLIRKGALERIDIIGNGQEYVVFPTDERYVCQGKPREGLNFSNQVAIPQEWISGKRQVPGTLDDLEHTVMLGIHSSFVEQAPGWDDIARFYSGLCMLSRMTGRQYPEEVGLLVDYMVTSFSEEIKHIGDKRLQQSDFAEDLRYCIDVMRKLKPEEADNMQREYDRVMKGK